jgi:hypothetical protein
MFCYLFTDYIFVQELNPADGSIWMATYGWELVDGSVGTGAL